jgi:hypothetical protein
MQISPHERDERVQIMDSFIKMHEDVMSTLKELTENDND